MRKGLFSFDMGERILKRGWLTLSSPRILKMVLSYHLGGWSKKPLYKLCCGAFVASDQNKLKSFKGKCYKWGYFTEMKELKDERFKLNAFDKSVSLMWCARFLNWKHPEIPVKMAVILKARGYNFMLDFYGNGDEEETTKQLAHQLNVEDVVTFHGAKPNAMILQAMRMHDIFLVTSNRLEGWGAVMNESMGNGCVVVASDCIGSTPYLINEGVTGFSFKCADVDSLTEKVQWLLEHHNEMRDMQRNAYQQMKNIWNPKNAAECLLQLIKDIQNGQLSSIQEGPCSKAK
jgi:glycosyltransferase involved in cell wall biosynthesis